MGKKCISFSSKPGYVRVCEFDERGNCTKNCKDVKRSALHPRIAIEHKRFENAVARYLK